jgi:hypothetical protein
MSVGYRAVEWNRAKVIYDAILVPARRYRSHVRQLQFRGSVSCGTVEAAPQPEPISENRVAVQSSKGG